MRRSLPALAASMALLTATIATGAPLSRVYLVPALKKCDSAFAACVPREFESRYTFDTIILRSPATRYLPTNKPSLYLDVRGVRDPSGALLTGNLTLRVISGRVGLASLGTLPDDFALAQVPPVAVPLRNGRNKRFAYRPDQTPPAGTIVNGGGVELYDPDGKLLAVVGTQARP